MQLPGPHEGPSLHAHQTNMHTLTHARTHVRTQAHLEQSGLLPGILRPGAMGGGMVPSWIN